MLVRRVLQLWAWLVGVTACRAALIDLSAYQDLITMVHNLYRRYERAADMKQLTWDPHLQRRAELWSERCYWGHQGKGLGENLAYFWTTGPDMEPLDIILRSCQNWWKEVNDWNWSRRCQPACHYTQMIWGKTARIGCSLSKCSNMATDGGEAVRNANYFVCFYDPPGNFIGRHPYTLGDNCTKCELGDTCNDGLCSSPAPAQPQAPPQAQPPAEPKPTLINPTYHVMPTVPTRQPIFYEWE